MPGYLIIKVLNIEDEFNLTEKIVYSFTFGIAFTIVSYFIFYLMSFRSGLYIFGPILSTVAIILSIKKIMRIGINNLKIFQKIDYRLMFIMLLLLMFSFAGVSLTNLPPDITGITIIYEDLLWIIGNTDSLMRSFPVFDSRFAGLDFKYHYFVFIFRAVTSLITKISSERLFFVYSQFIMIPYLVLSLYIFAQTVFNNARKSRFFVWLFLFTGCASMYCLLFNWIGFFFNVTIIDLVIFPNGLDLATPTILLLTNVLIKIYRKNCCRMGETIAVAILTALLTGSKGPFGIMMVGTIFVMFIISLIKRDAILLNLKLFISTLVPFSVIYFFFLSGTGLNSLKISPGATVLNTVFGSIIIKGLDILNLNIENLQYLLGNLATPFHFFLFLPFVALPFIFWFVIRIKKFRTVKQEELLIGGLALCGIIVTYLISMDGSSQLAFIIGATAFIEICALIWIFDNYNHLNKFPKHFIIATFIVATISSFAIFSRTSIVGIRTAYSAFKLMIMKQNQL